MSDQIEHMGRIFASKEFENKIEKDLLHILKKFISKKNIKFKPTYSFKNDNIIECFAGYKVDKEQNIFNEEVEIILKPDHSEHRRMRLLIREGSKIFQKCEDYDRSNWSDKEVFILELKKLEKDLSHLLKKMIKDYKKSA